MPFVIDTNDFGSDLGTLALAAAVGWGQGNEARTLDERERSRDLDRWRLQQAGTMARDEMTTARQGLMSQLATERAMALEDARQRGRLDVEGVRQDGRMAIEGTRQAGRESLEDRRQQGRTGLETLRQTGQSALAEIRAKASAARDAAYIRNIDSLVAQRAKMADPIKPFETVQDRLLREMVESQVRRAENELKAALSSGRATAADIQAAKNAVAEANERYTTLINHQISAMNRRFPNAPQAAEPPSSRPQRYREIQDRGIFGGGGSAAPLPQAPAQPPAPTIPVAPPGAMPGTPAGQGVGGQSVAVRLDNGAVVPVPLEQYRALAQQVQSMYPGIAPDRLREAIRQLIAGQ